jgi:multiple sugar transport system substrate-binding protein/sn-glycerol 3-phosphate transport system substrate-binding protein
MRTPLWLTPLLLSAALAVSACTAVPTAPAAAPAEAPAEAAAAEGAYADVDPSGQTVVWWHQHSDSREEGLLALIAEFNATNEYGITVEAQNQGGYDEIRDKVNSSIAAGELPATLLVGYQNDQSFYQLNDTLVDLNLLMNDPTWGMSAEEIADFYPAFLEQSVNPLFDGQRLGFPPNRSMEVIFYNQSWLEELGFSGPPTTPAEFQEMACAGAAANGDGTGGYILRDDASAVASWTFAFGGNVLTEEGNGYLYNSPATVEAMTFLKGLYDAGCAYFFTEGYPNPQFAARKALFAQGSTSGIPFYGGDLATVAAEQGREPDGWGVAAIPHTTEQPVQNIYGGDVMITKTTPEQEVAAWLFVKWFTSPEIQARWTGVSGYFPTRASTADFFSEVQMGDAQYLQGVALLPFSAYEPQLISYTAVRDAATKAFNEIMQGADIQSTLDTLTAFANEQEETMLAEAR